MKSSIKWRSKAARVIAGLGVIVVLSGCLDNMYPTANYHAECADFSSTDSLGHYCQTDGRALTYYYQSTLSDGDKAGIRTGLDKFEPTVLDPTYQAAVYSGTQETDIIYYKGALGANVAGITYCEDAATTTICDQHYVKYNSSQTVDRVAGCHESGHAVGLTHGSNAADENGDPAADNDPILGCMRTPYDYFAFELGDANAAEIDNTY